MSHFILHKKTRKRFHYMTLGLACLMVVCVTGYAVHSIGTARAKSREMVPIHTEEEFRLCLLDRESEEYNLNGRYRLEEDLDLSWLEQSVGTNIEPFTGKFDGNGHVISGLGRPLFGVMDKAEVENLFLGETMILQPFTYFDGERYVDGYCALAAYAVNSTIRNCGIGGEIDTASPAEAEYQMEKAKPQQTDEEKGPGMQDGPGVTEPSGRAPGEVTEESGGTDEENIAGPGADTEEKSETVETELGPGVETSVSQGESESRKESEGQKESAPVIPDESAQADQDNQPAQSGEETKEAQTGNGDSEKEEPSTGKDPSEQQEPSAEKNQPVQQEPTTEKEQPEQEQTTKEEQPAQEGPDTPAEDAAKEGSVEVGTQGVDSRTGILSETVGCRPVDRHYLMMKTSPLIDVEAEAAVIASPSDAAPSDTVSSESALAEDTSSEDILLATPSDAEHPEEQLEYIGNPNGDVYILVTASRVTAGGLVAQTAGETLISDSFTLITLESGLGEVDTYAGGFAGILGGETRIENSYASGLVDSNGVTGGFVSVNDGTIENSYSSISVGETGTRRGAFTAFGDGTLSGCIYDRQIACVQEEENPDTESALKGLDTAQMTGLETRIPGNWFLVEDAYPQIEYFAVNEHEILSTSSKVSAVALVLPEGVLLSDILKGGELVLPFTVDGQELLWEAEGGIIIDENNQVVSGEKAFISSHEVLTVQSSMESAAVEDRATDESMESMERTLETDIQTDIDPYTEHTSDSEHTGFKLKASVGNISRSFALTALLADSSYSSWEDVGKSLDASSQPKQNGDGYYEITNGAQLAWFAYQVNSGQPSLNAKLMKNIDLFGNPYVGDGYDGTEADFARGLPWIPIGNTAANQYIGIFDGNSCEISNLKVEGGSSNDQAFIRYFANPGVIKDFGVASGVVQTSADVAGGIIGKIKNNTASTEGAQVLRCWNGASIEYRSYGGGIVGYIDSALNLVVEDCYNQGTITGTGSCNGGLFGQINGGRNIMIKDCYNEGEVKGNSYGGGISGYTNSVTELTFDGCYNQGDILLDNATIGGLSGRLSYGSDVAIKDCYNKGIVSAKGNFGGGMIGYAESVTRLTLDGAYNLGDITSQGNTGGMIGQISNLNTITIKNCFNSGEIKSVGTSGAGIVAYSNSTNVVIEGCYNSGKIITGSSGSAGIMGTNYDGFSITVQNCYNLGEISGEGNGAGIVSGLRRSGKVINCFNAGKFTVKGAVGAICNSVSSATVTNCYYSEGTSSISQTQSVTAEQLQSWAAAFALNGQGLVQTDSEGAEAISWTYLPGSPHPTFYKPEDTATTKLAPAKDWSEVGRGIDDKLIGPFVSRVAVPAGDGGIEPYKIGSAEQLAWFAYKVNTVSETGDRPNSSLDANLTSDIASFAGTSYGGGEMTPIPWVPMDDYTGTFGAGHERPYTLSKLYTKTPGRAGLFGAVKGNASISNIGIIDSDITGDTAGGIVAEVGEDAVVSTCYNKSRISANGAAESYIGGIAGKVSGNGKVVDCYDMNSTVTSTVTGAFPSYAGGIAGGISSSSGTVQNCYSVGSTVKASCTGGSSGSGSIAGTVSTGAVRQCYAVNPGNGNDSANNVIKASEAEMKSQSVTNGLNVPGGTEAERTGASRVWYTSLSDEETGGYPTFTAPKLLTVELDPAETISGSTASLTAESGVLPDNCLFRDIHFENTGTTGYALNLTAKSELERNFNTYGLTNALGSLTLMAGSVDLAGIKDKASLTDPVQPVAKFSSITLYNAAAYLDTSDRMVLLDLSSGTTRYEVRIKIRKVKSKTLSLTFSVNPTIDLKPGMHRESEANQDVKVTNGNAYPVAGSITAVTNMTDGGKSELHPIAPNLSIYEEKQLDEAGVKLGITGARDTPETVIGAKKYYFNPEAGESGLPWIHYELGSGTSFSYRYFMEYSPLYAGEEKTFGYNITYTSSISPDDIPVDKVKVTGNETGG